MTDKEGSVSDRFLFESDEMGVWNPEGEFTQLVSPFFNQGQHPFGCFEFWFYLNVRKHYISTLMTTDWFATGTAKRTSAQHPNQGERPGC